MTIGLFVTINVTAGKEKEFESVFAEQASNCRKNEPHQKLYQLLRSKNEALTYHVMELYDDAAALDAHLNGAHMAITRDRMLACVSGKITVLRGEL